MSKSAQASLQAANIIRAQRESLKHSLGEQILNAIRRKEWTYRETAIEASRHLPTDRQLSAANVWTYAHARALPKADVLEALAKALDRQFETETYEAAISLPGLFIEDLEGGYARLQINQRLPWSTVLRILDQLKGGVEK